jgi:hypothetical protein
MLLQGGFAFNPSNDKARACQFLILNLYKDGSIGKGRCGMRCSYLCCLRQCSYDRLSSGPVSKHKVLLQPVDDGDVPPNSSEMVWFWPSGYNCSPHSYLQLIICRSVHQCMYLQSIMCTVGTWSLDLSHVYS